MPDNVGYTPGSGATIAADDVGGALLQRVKIVQGIDGVNDGDVASSNPLPVQEASGAMSLLRRILERLMSPVGFDMSLDRSRVTAVLESGTVTTVSTVTTVTTVTGLTNIDGRNGAMLIDQTNLSAWANIHRARIT
jgi:hypothetical protein